ncbi:MAG TPA: electron transport complex subunit RsxC [Candidatus Omnitrophota bacterium]|nr:electron transport complex subunit RsxC [Candidatus Omnitrophota bacterium]HPN56615.1 electron transport complex subunit RsxC [Candidatus Omnitrophota bacterium]
MRSGSPKTFPQGGVHPHDSKLSADKPLSMLPLPKTVAILLSQHIGAPAVPLVKAGDFVKTGQLIARAEGFVSANIHASVTGNVKKIDPVKDVTGYKRPAVILDVQEDEWAGGIDRGLDLKKDIPGREDIIAKIAAAGIVGLGGAAFPSHVKLSPPKDKPMEFLLINGVECEPYLTADHRLMVEKSEEVVTGVRILLKGLGIDQACIGIEENKPDAIDILAAAARDYPGIRVEPLKVCYPQGGERQLVKALTGREIPPPPKGLPSDVGCAVFNVGTVFAVYEAVQKNKPLIERVVTVTGPAIQNPSNFWVRVGTPFHELIKAAGGLPDKTGKIIAGGPMMGRALDSTDIPVTKGTSGLLVLPEDQAKRELVENCIRCAKCVFACPLGLEPYLLMALVERNQLDRAFGERVLSCCECSCCSFVCPSHRPLLDYIRLGKANVFKKLKEQKQK